MERIGTIRGLVLLYLVATVATLVVMGVQHDAATVTQEAWVHGVIVLVFAVVLTGVAARVAAGSRAALVRLRVIGVVVPVVSIVLAVLPGVLPGWMRVEQAVYGALLAIVAVLAFGVTLPETA